MSDLQIENQNGSYAERLKQRRFARMRQGKNAATFVQLPSDPEIRVALVPLTEAEFDNALAEASVLNVPNNAAGISRLDRTYTRHVLIQSLRNPENFEERIWDSASEMMETLDSTDVDYLIDQFNEMTATANPTLDGIPPAEFEFLKESLQRIDWNALSGQSWHAAKRFLGALLSDGQLRGSGLGFTSINKSTTTNE